MLNINNLPVITQSYSNIANHLSADEQRAIAIHLAELPAFLATKTGGDAVRLLVEEFFKFVFEKHGLANKN